MIMCTIAFLILATAELRPEESGQVLYSASHSLGETLVRVEELRKADPAAESDVTRYQIAVTNFMQHGPYVTAELEGEHVTKSWATDLDHDGSLEVVIWTSSTGSGAYGDLLFYEVVDSRLQRYVLPDSKLLEEHGFAGHDGFEISGDRILRSFPVYGPADANCCPSGGEATATYRLVANRLELERVASKPAGHK